ncbi:MAG: hypothetical protein ABJP45_06540 [Cyclobacteriaceae bacterium]
MLEPTTIATTKFKDQALQVLGVFVLVSVFDPIIFKILHDHFENSKEGIYRLFNILYCAVPLVVLYFIWFFTGEWDKLKKDRLSSRIVPLTILLLFSFVALFVFPLNRPFYFATIAVTLFVLGLIREYHKKAKGEMKRTVSLYGIGALVVLLLMMFLVSEKIKYETSASVYIAGFEEEQQLRDVQDDLTDSEDSLAVLMFREGDLVKAKTIRSSVGKLDYEIQYRTRETASKFLPLFRGIRVKELMAASLIIVLLLWLLSYLETFKVKATKEGGKVVFKNLYDVGTIRASAWVFVLILLSHAQTVKVEHISAKTSGFMYYMDNWYSPGAVSNVINNSIVHNTNHEGDNPTTVNHYNFYLDGIPVDSLADPEFLVRLKNQFVVRYNYQPSLISVNDEELTEKKLKKYYDSLKTQILGFRESLEDSARVHGTVLRQQSTWLYDFWKNEELDKLDPNK